MEVQSLLVTTNIPPAIRQHIGIMFRGTEFRWLRLLYIKANLIISGEIELYMPSPIFLGSLRTFPSLYILSPTRRSQEL